MTPKDWERVRAAAELLYTVAEVQADQELHPAAATVLTWLDHVGGIAAYQLKAIEGGGGPQLGYGAWPHVSEAKRREGYPSGQRLPRDSIAGMRPARPWRAACATSRLRMLRANDAASRPEKQAVLASQCALFLPALEKSSIKSKS